jgi:hypothetical protein
MGSPYKTSQLNKEKANRITRKWMKRSGQYKKGKIIPPDEFYASMGGQGFKGLAKAVKSIIIDELHSIEQKLSKKAKVTKYADSKKLKQKKKN